MKQLFIHEFRIYEEHRGKGHFKLLIAEAKRIAKELNIHIIALYLGSSETDEDRLEKLYERYGFINRGTLMELELPKS